MNNQFNQNPMPLPNMPQGPQMPQFNQGYAPMGQAPVGSQPPVMPQAPQGGGMPIPPMPNNQQVQPQAPVQPSPIQQFVQQPIQVPQAPQGNQYVAPQAPTAVEDADLPFTQEEIAQAPATAHVEENAPVAETNAPVVETQPEEVAPVAEEASVEEVQEVQEAQPEPVEESQEEVTVEDIEAVKEEIIDQNKPEETPTEEEVVVQSVAKPAEYGQRFAEQIEKHKKKLKDDEVVFFIDSLALIEAVTQVRRFTAPKAGVKTMGLIYMRLSDDVLELQAFNEETHIRRVIPNGAEGNNYAATSDFFEVCFFAEQFAPPIQALKSLKEFPAEIGMKFNKNHVELNFKTSKTRMSLYEDVSDFMKLEALENDNVITFKGDYLKDLINATSYATSSSDTRPILKGVNFQLYKEDAKIITAVATDSHRLAKFSVDLEKGKAGLDENFVLPSKTATEIASLIKADDSVEVTIDKQTPQFVFGDTTIRARQLEGNYPDTARLIPDHTSSTTSIDVRVSKLRDALNYATSFVSAQRNKNITLFVVPEKKQIRVFARDAEAGQSVQRDFFAEDAKGNPLAIVFNNQFMKEGLKKYNDEDVITINFFGNLKPFTFHLKAGSPDDLDLLLPVRSSEGEDKFNGKLKGFIKTEQTSVFDFDDF